MKIAVFASGGGSNFSAVQKKILEGCLKSSIDLVVSNNSRCGAAEKASLYGIEFFHISGRTHPDPLKYREALLEKLASTGIELILLAGYMKLVPDYLIAAYPRRILNIHPGILPEYGGKGMYGINVHKAVIEAGAKESGVTVHIVDENYDTGPVVRQEKVPVLPEDTPETLAVRVLRKEHDTYWRAVKDFEEGKF
ncbi:MAG: phosphoribosylglycinamide formyltransferase [Fibrobacterota bacterium]